MGVGATKKWERIESYGPKFVENIIQAVSRDILCQAMKNLQGRYICGHVHDELIIECPVDTPVSEITEAMAEKPDWMPGLDMRADADEAGYYKKERESGLVGWRVRLIIVDYMYPQFSDERSSGWLGKLEWLE
mgnify:CR=1 FL=1